MHPLTALANKYKTDKGTNQKLKKGFTEIYGPLFDPIRKTVKSVFEIGVARGASLYMWEEYFPNATIYGIDIHKNRLLTKGRIISHLYDQSNRLDLKIFVAFLPSLFDIIIDDGGHKMNQQQISLGFLFPHLRPGGFYIIEDLHTSFLLGFCPKDNRFSTFNVLDHFNRTGFFHSPSILESESTYLDKELISCKIYHLPFCLDPSLAVLIKK